VPGAIRRPALALPLRRLELPPAPTAPQQRPRGASPNYPTSAAGFIVLLEACSEDPRRPATVPPASAWSARSLPSSTRCTVTPMNIRVSGWTGSAWDDVDIESGHWPRFTRPVQLANLLTEVADA
jgi:hypothetical protein